MARDLTDRVIAITGASSGIGAATAMACAAAGMHVCLAARHEPKLRQVAEQIEKLGRRTLVMAADVTRDEDVGAFIGASAETFGRLDAVFANAGFGLFASVTDTTDEQMRSIFETNYFGTLRVIRAAVPIMKQAGAGHILICSSAVSEIAQPMYGAYCATKAAQDSIAGALRAELDEWGIDVSSVHPIGTRTGFFERIRDHANDPDVPFNTPTSFMQSPQRVARAIVSCLRRPRPEVWPHVPSRLGIAICTAVPQFAAWANRGMMKKFKNGAKAKM